MNYLGIIGFALLLESFIFVGIYGQNSTSSSKNNVTLTTTTIKSLITSTSPTSIDKTTKDPYSEYVGPIRKCPKGTDAQLNECMKLILKDLKPRLAKGVPEIDLPPLDPLHLNQSNFQQGYGAIVIKAVFTNISVHHLSNFTDAEFTVNSKAKQLKFVMNVPRILIEGTYNLGGNILFFEIGGTGPYWFDIGDVHVHGVCNLKKVKRPADGKKIVLVDNIKIDIDIEKIKVKLLNLFNGNPVLGPLINNVLNENGQDLFQDIKPNVSAEVGEIMTSIVNAVISNLEFIGDYID